MRVFVFPEKVYEKLGAKRWEVEWWEVTAAARKRVEASEARGELDEYDRDSDIKSLYRVFPYRAKGLAIAYAQKMAYGDHSAYGSATVIEQVVDWYVKENGIAEWINSGDKIIVD